VATFSRQNVEEAIRFNSTNYETYLSLNFANYVDYQMSGKSKVQHITEKMLYWMLANLGEALCDKVALIGTGALTSETISL